MCPKFLKKTCPDFKPVKLLICNKPFNDSFEEKLEKVQNSAALIYYWINKTGLDKLRARLRVCMQCARKELFACTKLHAHKSIKTPLSNIPMLFKVVSCFCV